MSRKIEVKMAYDSFLIMSYQNMANNNSWRKNVNKYKITEAQHIYMKQYL